jgi:hypothetical protein
MWSIEERAYPTTGTDRDRFRFLISYAVLAPSAHNTQPWKFSLAGDTVDLRADRSRSLRETDPDNRELVIGCGAALLNLRLAIRHFGNRDCVEVLPEAYDPDLLARVRLGEHCEPEPSDERCFAAMQLRHTNRLPFDRRRISESLLSGQRQQALRENTRLHFVEGAQRGAVAEVIARGEREQMSRRGYRKEFAMWMRSNSGACSDGLPGYALGLGSLASRMAPFLLKKVDLGHFSATRNYRLAVEAPALAVLETMGDDRREWLQAGQGLSRVLLYARANSLWASFFNQPMKSPGLRAELRRCLAMRGFPQLVFRVGYGPYVPAVPRRPVEEVIAGE